MGLKYKCRKQIGIKAAQLSQEEDTKCPLAEESGPDRLVIAANES